MILAPSYDHIEKILNEKMFPLGHGFAEGLPINTKTVGFILFDQNFDRAPIKDIVGNLDMINLHSGSDIHFFLCGVSKHGSNDSDGKELGSLNDVKLYHNAGAVFSFIDAFAHEIAGWKYDFGVELVLIDLTVDGDRRYLNFQSAVFFKIEELIKLKIIERPSEFFGKLVKFARDTKLSSASAFRDELRRAFGVNWLKGLILAMFPKSVGKLARAEAALGGGAALPE